MQYQVFVKNPAVRVAFPLGNRVFMASVMGLPNVTADGVTEQDAIDKLKAILAAQFKNGKLLTIDVDIPNELTEDKNDPWLANMGIFQDDPTFDEFLAEINAYRNEVDIIEGRS